MNDENDAASGQQCRVCGGRIGQGEGDEIAWDEDTTVYVHDNCA